MAKRRTKRGAVARSTSRRVRKGTVDRDRRLSKAQRGWAKRLRRFYERNGYMRSPPDPSLFPRPHRGYELRFSALEDAECDEIVGLLRRLGVEPGKPFAKGPHWRIPIYGKEQVEALLAWMGVSDKES